jgi:hypothetical protein
MTLLPAIHEPFYRDGPTWPHEPGRDAIERAYRDAFHVAAREAALWTKCDDGQVKAAWTERHKARKDGRIVLPDGVYGYEPSHEVEAARTRGRVQALEFARECREKLAKEQVPEEFVRSFVLKTWSQAVGHWALTPLALTVCPPPHPLCELTEDQRRALRTLGPQIEKHGRRPQLLIPRYRSVHELVLDHPRLQKPVLEGLLRTGEILNLVASPKTGKSWLVADLAIAVATGRVWLGLFPAPRGEVLLIDNELDGSTLANRIPKVAAARDTAVDAFSDSVFVETLRGNLADIFQLEEYFDEVEPGRFALIILDALFRFMPADMDENSNGAMTAVYNRLDQYARRLQSAIAVVHHTSKGLQGDKSVTDVGAGAGSQSRAADAHLVLRPHQEENVFVVDAAVRSWPPVRSRCLRWDFPVFHLADDLDPADLKRPRSRRVRAPKEAKPEKPEWTVEQFVGKFVADQPETKQAIIVLARAEGLSERKASDLLRRAEEAGQVHRWIEGRNKPQRFATVSQQTSATHDNDGEAPGQSQTIRSKAESTPAPE